MPWNGDDDLIEPVRKRLEEAGHPPLEIRGELHGGLYKLTIRWASGRDWSHELVPEVEAARSGETDEWVARKALAWIARGGR